MGHALKVGDHIANCEMRDDDTVKVDVGKLVEVKGRSMKLAILIPKEPIPEEDWKGLVDIARRIKKER